MSQRDELTQALFRVQQRMPEVPKTGWNDHHKYAYASAEAVMGAARELLLEEGVLFSLSDTEVLVVGEQVVLQATFRFELGLHSRVMTMALPIHVSPKRPIDKAALACLTELRGYCLVHALMISRTDAPDVSGREDRDDGRQRQRRQGEGQGSQGQGSQGQGQGPQQRRYGRSQDARLKAGQYIDRMLAEHPEWVQPVVVRISRGREPVHMTNDEVVELSIEVRAVVEDMLRSEERERESREGDDKGAF